MMRWLKHISLLMLALTYGLYGGNISIAQTSNLNTATPAFVLEHLSERGVQLDKGWKFHPGDSIHWAGTGFDDRQWKHITPAHSEEALHALFANNTGWLRLHIIFDSALQHKPYYLSIQQNVASEIYLDGKLLMQYGSFPGNGFKVKAYNPLDQSMPVLFNLDMGEHIIAVRLHVPQQKTRLIYPQISNSLFTMEISPWSQDQKQVRNSFHNSFGMSLIKAAVFIIVLLLHFAFYFVYRKEKVNLWLGVFDLFNAAGYVLYALLVYKIHDVALSNVLRIPGSLVFTIGSWFLLVATYSGFAIKRGIAWWLFLVLMTGTVILYFTPYNNRVSSIVNPQTFLYPFLVCAESIRLSFLSLKKKSGAVNTLARVMIFCVLSITVAVIALQIQDFGAEHFNIIFGALVSISLLGLPISFFMYVAIEFKYFYHKLMKAQALRNKIALDLHDDLGTKLSAARMFLRSLKGDQVTGDKVLLENAVSLIDTSINDLRQVMNDLQSPTLIDKGYVAATEALVNKINGLQQINFSLSSNGINKRMEQKTEYNLFRITQELINNTLKYAEAKNVSIDIMNRDNKIIFMYEDDGNGFDMQRHSKGFGLTNILSRSETMGGDLEFDTQPGKGFRAVIEIPLLYA